MKTVIIEGWRYIPHSYAMVNQHLCLELLKRPDIRLFHRDVRYFMPTWRPTPNLWSPEDEAKLRSIPAPSPGMRADAMLRIGFPAFLSERTAGDTDILPGLRPSLERLKRPRSGRAVR
jgi:hypothetical protein